jgi:hypothetical protein
MGIYTLQKALIAQQAIVSIEDLCIAIGKVAMRQMKKVIASVCIALCMGAPLVLAAPPDQQSGPLSGKANGHGQQGQRNMANAPGNPGKASGPVSHANPGRHSSGNGQGQPPKDFGPIRDTIRSHRGEIGHGSPLPPGLVIAKGKPMPRGYGKSLPPGIVKQLPHYKGYEWRRLGTDMVLVAITTGIVYEILHNVLD